MANNPRLKTHPLKSELAQVTPGADQDAAAALSSPVDSPLKQKLLTLIANFYAFLSALKELYAKNRALGQQQELLTKALEAKLEFASNKKQVTSVAGNSLQLDELAKLRKQLAEIEEAIKKNKDVIDRLTQRLAQLTANQPQLQQVLQTVTSDITTALEQDSHDTAELFENAGIRVKLHNVLLGHEIYMPELPELMQQQLRTRTIETVADFRQQAEQIITTPSAGNTETNSDDTESVSASETVADFRQQSRQIITTPSADNTETNSEYHESASATEKSQTTTSAAEDSDDSENQVSTNKDPSARMLERTRDPLSKFLELTLDQRRLSFSEVLEAVLNTHPHLLSERSKMRVVKDDLMSVLSQDPAMCALEKTFAAKLTEKLKPKVLAPITVDHVEIRQLESQLLAAQAFQAKLVEQQSALALLLRPGASRQSINAAVQAPTPRFDRTSK